MLEFTAAPVDCLDGYDLQSRVALDAGSQPRVRDFIKARRQHEQSDEHQHDHDDGWKEPPPELTQESTIVNCPVDREPERWLVLWPEPKRRQAYRYENCTRNGADEAGGQVGEEVRHHL